jgi:tetratricopeptide (TPR) repeat protein
LRRVALAAVVVAVIFLSLALAALIEHDSGFVAALGSVGTVVAAVAAVAAVLQSAGRGERPSPRPGEQGSADPRRQGRGRDDAQEEVRRARRPDLTAEALWTCRVPDDDDYFCGRDELVASVITRMRAALAANRAAVALLVGQPGVGASSVAWAAARDLAADFPDGVFRVDLRGLVRELRRDTADVVELVARAAGLHLDSELRSNEQRLAALAARLDGRRVLLILDNARDAAHVARFVSPPIAAGIIVTSRSRSQSYVGRRLFFEVKPLSRDAAVKLLGMFTQDRSSSRGQLERLARLCAYVPLALNVIGRRIQSGVPGNLDTLIHWLERARLDHPVRAAIRLSYEDLEDHPSVQRAFRLLAAAPGYAGTSAEMADGTDEPGLYEQRLLTLVERSLAREETPYGSAGDTAATYWLYELVKEFARELLDEEEHPDAIRDFELNSVRFLRDRLREITNGSGLTAAADRLDPARYQAAEMMAEERGWPDLAADLADGLYVLFLDRGEEDTAADILDRIVRRFLSDDGYAAASAAALTAARRLDDRGATESAVQAATRAAQVARDHELDGDVARAYVMVSYLLGKLDDWKGALAMGEHAAQVLARLQPRSAAIPVLINNCRAAIELARTDDALMWAAQATELADSLGSDLQRAYAALERGRAESLAGNDEVAAEFSWRGGELFEGLRNWSNAGVGFGNAAIQSSGHVTPADMCGLLRRSVDNWAKASGDLSKAHFLTALVDLSAALADDGRLAQAAGALDQAVSLADDLGAVITRFMRFEVRLRDAGMWVVANQSDLPGQGVPISDVLRDIDARGGSRDQPDPHVRHVADALRLYATDGLGPDQAGEQIAPFLRSPARYRAEPFTVSMYSKPGELSA